MVCLYFNNLSQSNGNLNILGVTGDATWTPYAGAKVGCIGIYSQALTASEKTAITNWREITSDNSSVVTSYISATNKLNISIPSIPNAYIKIFTDIEIPIINNYLVKNNTTWNGCQGYSGGEPGSINDNISNFTKLRPSNICNFLNLQMVNNVYIASPNLGSFDTVSSFSHNIIKKVPVTANYGYMIYDPYMTTNDF